MHLRREPQNPNRSSRAVNGGGIGNHTQELEEHPVYKDRTLAGISLCSAVVFYVKICRDGRSSACVVIVVMVNGISFRIPKTCRWDNKAQLYNKAVDIFHIWSKYSLLCKTAFYKAGWSKRHVLKPETPKRNHRNKRNETAETNLQILLYQCYNTLQSCFYVWPMLFQLCISPQISFGTADPSISFCITLMNTTAFRRKLVVVSSKLPWNTVVGFYKDRSTFWQENEIPKRRPSLAIRSLKRHEIVNSHLQLHVE